MIKSSTILTNRKLDIILTLFTFFLVNIICNFSCHENKQSTNRGMDTISAIKNKMTEIAEIYSEDERKCIDSVSFYKLDSINLICLKYLYVLYGNELIANPSTGKKISIGECNIKLVYFKSRPLNIKLLGYHVFINGSLPAASPIISSWGTIISGFYVNNENKEIINATDEGDETEIKIANLQKLYNSALNSPIFKNYIDTNKKHLHPKFISLLEGIKVLEKR